MSFILFQTTTLSYPSSTYISSSDTDPSPVTSQKRNLQDCDIYICLVCSLLE